MWMMAVRAGSLRQYYKIMPQEMCHSGTASHNVSTLISTILKPTPVGFLELIALVCNFFRWMEKRHDEIIFSFSFHTAPLNFFQRMLTEYAFPLSGPAIALRATRKIQMD